MAIQRKSAKRKSLADQAVIGPQERTILLEMAEQLREYGRGRAELPNHRAMAFAAQLKRIVDPPDEPPFTKIKEISVAYSYALRVMLAGGRGSLKLRQEVARLYRTTPSAVSTLSGRWKAASQHRIATIAGNTAYTGLSPDEMIQREIENTDPPPPAKRIKPKII